MKRQVKELLTHLGAHMPVSSTRALNATINYLEVGRWLEERGFVSAKRLKSREDVFAVIARQVRGSAVLYLEFGVHEGESLRTWSRLLPHPKTRLHGFDSFEGLLETWSYAEPAGHFSTNGIIPAFDDPRIEIFKGWFDETLQHYSLPAHERLVVNIDSDLYSSAAVVLDRLTDAIVPGTVLYFDEFHDRSHELRACSDFVDRTGITFRLVAATRELSHVAFVRER
jgi:Macrocin-O-methyltransferase (TylF)